MQYQLAFPSFSLARAVLVRCAPFVRHLVLRLLQNFVDSQVQLGSRCPVAAHSCGDYDVSAAQRCSLACGPVSMPSPILLSDKRS